MHRLTHWLFGCAGWVDRETDRYGVEWIGLRCAKCGRLKSKTIGCVQAFRALTDGGRSE